MLKINILGTHYEIIKKQYKNDELFEKNGWAGYCNEILKEIVICDISTHPEFENASKKEIQCAERDGLRHEIVHAFLNESGLSYCSLNYSGAWAKNEEMVDWFAIQGEKIYNAWLVAEDLFFAPSITFDGNFGERMAKAVVEEIEKNSKRKMGQCAT